MQPARAQNRTALRTFNRRSVCRCAAEREVRSLITQAADTTVPAHRPRMEREPTHGWMDLYEANPFVSSCRRSPSWSAAPLFAAPSICVRRSLTSFSTEVRPPERAFAFVLGPQQSVIQEQPLLKGTALAFIYASGGTVDGVGIWSRSAAVSIGRRGQLFE